MSKPSEAKCPRCAAPLPPSAPEGLCPRCLGALNLVTDTVLTGADAIAAQPPLTPAELAPHFPQLEIIECLGRGGMGVVYRVRQKALNRLAALKLLAPERVTDAGFAERFTREAQALARLNHPNIVTIYDFGCTRAGGLQPPSGAQPEAQNSKPETAPAGFYFLLMEFMDGVNLRQAMRTERFTPEQALAIVPPVCEALQYAHEQGIVHRDIKPENLLLDKVGRLKIADFGIAKILEPGRAELPTGQREEAAQQRGPTTQESFTAGTPGYMAPEQKSAPQRVDSRADIYSLGVVIYEMLTGELPAEKLQPPSRKVQIDVRLDEIVLRALEQRPELRFQTAADLRTQVETFGREDREERIEKSKQPPSLSSTLSPLSSSPARFLKAGTSTLTTPEQLATASGQFFCYRTRGQLILDDRQLMHSLAGVNTVIPLAAIRDLSIGHYPRSMNPAGIDLLSVTYEEGGQRKQVLLSPLEGWFAFPATWDARVAEWHAAIRSAVTAATGRAPASTPPEKLGVPGSHFALLAMMALPVLVPALVFLFFLTRLSSSGDSAGRSTLVAIFVFGMVLLGFLLPLLFGRRTKLSPDSAAPSAAPRSPWRIALGVIALVAALPIAALLTYMLSYSPSSGVKRFTCIPVGVSNNVVIVDVTTEVGRGNAELRAMLDGPQLPAATEAALAEAFFPPFAGTFIKPTTHAGNHPWRILSPGRQTWRLGFVLPDAALARDAIESLHPVGPLPAVPDRTFAGTLFEVRQTNGQMFRASLQVALPFTSADPDWVSVFGHSQHNESAVTLTWEVLAAGHGLAHFSRGGTPIVTLQPNPQTKLHGISFQLELTKTGTNLVQLVRRIHGETIREELPGNFRELADELLRTATFSAKATSGTKIALCQFQGNPLIVQVHVTDSPGTYQLKLGAVVALGVAGLVVLGAGLWLVWRRKQSGARAGSVADVLLGGLVVLCLGIICFGLLRNLGLGMAGAGPVRIWAMGAVVLPIAAGGIVLLIVLVRKGGSASKAVMLLVGVPLLCVAVFIAVWVLSRAKSAVSATELEAGLAADALPAETSTVTNAVPAIPQHIEFKVLRVENPPGTRDILLHFQRDTNAALGLEVWQDVTPSPGLRKQPQPGTYRDGQVKTWAGVNDRVLGWTLPPDFTEAEARAVAKDIEQRAKSWRELEDGRLWEFATVKHRDGWKYHLLATVKRARE